MDAESKAFIGTLVVSQLLKAIFLRTEMAASLRTPFAIFCDEFQNFATPDFARLFMETGKFDIMPMVAHQDRVGQLKLEDPNRGATMASPSKALFSLSVPDSREMAPVVALKVEATEKRREAELVLSPRPVEDLWERGHPPPEVMDIRGTYFWIVEDLRNTPNEKYFKFDPLRTNMANTSFTSVGN